MLYDLSYSLKCIDCFSFAFLNTERFKCRNSDKRRRISADHFDDANTNNMSI